MNHLKIILKWVLPSIKFAYKMLAVSAEVFCRHSFGPRYTPSLVVGFLFCFLTMTLVCAIDPNKSSPVIGIYLIVFFGLVIYHLVKMWFPRTITHSQSGGQSWSFWERTNVRPTIVKILFEPAVQIFIGVVVHPLSVLLSDWLLIAGMCLAIKEFISFWKHWNRVLDSSDARIEGERISTGVRRYSAPQSGREQGASQVAAVEQAQPPTNSIRQIYSHLDPALQQLVATANQNRRGPPGVAGNPVRPVGTRPTIGPNRNQT